MTKILNINFIGSKDEFKKIQNEKEVTLGGIRDTEDILPESIKAIERASSHEDGQIVLISVSTLTVDKERQYTLEDIKPYVENNNNYIGWIFDFSNISFANRGGRSYGTTVSQYLLDNFMNQPKWFLINERLDRGKNISTFFLNVRDLLNDEGVRKNFIDAHYLCVDDSLHFSFNGRLISIEPTFRTIPDAFHRNPACKKDGELSINNLFERLKCGSVSGSKEEERKSDVGSRVIRQLFQKYGSAFLGRIRELHTKVLTPLSDVINVSVFISGETFSEILPVPLDLSILNLKANSFLNEEVPVVKRIQKVSNIENDFNNNFREFYQRIYPIRHEKSIYKNDYALNLNSDEILNDFNKETVISFQHDGIENRCFDSVFGDIEAKLAKSDNSNQWQKMYFDNIKNGKRITCDEKACLPKCYYFYLLSVHHEMA